MHRDYMRSLPSVRSLNGFAGLEEYNHDTDITGSLADTVLLAGHGRPGHLADRKPERWEQRATVCAAVRAAFRAGVGCDIPVYHVVPLGSRLADLFPGGGGSRRGGAGVGLILTKKLPGVAEPPPFIVFLLQYGAIWLSIFVLTQGPLRVIWLKWRYQGGQWFVSRSARAEEYSYQQQPVPAPQVVRAGNPDRLLSPGDLTVLQPVQAYACACGFAFDRAAGNFCPQCGRPMVQQGVS